MAKGSVDSILVLIQKHSTTLNVSLARTRNSSVNIKVNASIQCPVGPNT